MIKVQKIINTLISYITLFVFSYLIFIFPFDILSTWLGKPTSLFEFLGTTIVFGICLYYFRSKSTNKIIKFFVYEGIGVGTVSFFIILPLIIISYVQILIDFHLVILFFTFQIPTIIYGYVNSKNLKLKNYLSSQNVLEKVLNLFLSVMFTSDQMIHYL